MGGHQFSKYQKEAILQKRVTNKQKRMNLNNMIQNDMFSIYDYLYFKLNFDKIQKHAIMMSNNKKYKNKDKTEWYEY